MSTIALLILVFFAVWLINKFTARESFATGGFVADSSAASKVVTLHYTNWCPHCVAIKPTWQKVRDAFAADPTVRFAENDEDQKITPGVKGIPTIMLENNGRKIKYPGGNDAGQLISWINAN